MKKLDELMKDTKNTVYVVKDDSDVIMGVFDTNDDAKGQVSDLQKGDDDLKFNISKDERSNYEKK